ncbi:MAG: riboflavin synthase [Flavobacteriales bacterium]
MFTGIIEAFGKVVTLEREMENLHITLESSLSKELKIDQSLAHNGVCLTVVKIVENNYTVTAIKETLDKSNMNELKVGDLVNLERAMKMNARLDGHIVQGHVDQVGYCSAVEFNEGSWEYSFEYDSKQKNITVEKGSITVNGVSLTVVNSGKNTFSVAIIPYTFEHTNFKAFKVGSKINLEFDLIGKYIAKLNRI